MNLPTGKRTGFATQNVAKVIPQLVKRTVQPATTQEEEADGMLHGDNVELMPLIMWVWCLT